MLLFCFFQSQPEDHAGAGEAQSRARETQILRPGEEPQAARAYVCNIQTVRLLVTVLNSLMQHYWQPKLNM